MASGLLQALVPFLFVLALGFAAGRHHSFTEGQATGFNTLLVNFALPAMLFASTVAISRSQLLVEGKTVLVFLITYAGLFLLVVAAYRWMTRRTLPEASIAGLLFASSAAPYFGPTVMIPLYGAQSGLLIALAALVINVAQVPLAILLLNSPSNSGQQDGASRATCWSSLKHPVVIAPSLALVLVLTGVTLPGFCNPLPP